MEKMFLLLADFLSLVGKGFWLSVLSYVPWQAIWNKYLAWEKKMPMVFAFHKNQIYFSISKNYKFYNIESQQFIFFRFLRAVNFCSTGISEMLASYLHWNKIKGLMSRLKATTVKL